ncbi:glycosyltransferase family 4 protein [Campylobacter sp. 7477a]|uniref:glycosyltransferase family 4 protein n=1 Tax=Campylobacter sp. 7477a TaxID=2735741 RepID=UPI0030142C28|nr:glycosyltransferase family 4 protein [Campylobacter sp. 7477a]
MKVVQLLPELNEGGVERGVVEITREFNKYNIKSYVISGGGKLVSEIEKNGVTHITADVYSKNLLTMIQRVLKLRKILKEIEPDIVHVRSRVPAWLLKFAKIGLNLNIVSTVHGINTPNFYSKIMTDADKIICVSNAVKEHIIKHFNVQNDKISVVFRGVDLTSFDPKNLADKRTLRDKFNIESELVISVVGRITQIKNIETILKATALLKQNFSSVCLIVAGGAHPKKEEYFNKLKALTKELGLDKNVKFLGSISEVAKIYKLSDVVVSATLKPESFGRSVAEAIALNTPVVASNHGGVKDIIKDGENGYFFEPLDEAELSKKILLARELKFDGFNYIKEKFNLENMTKETIKIYKDFYDTKNNL